jgi:hypothetical protein
MRPIRPCEASWTLRIACVSESNFMVI